MQTSDNYFTRDRMQLILFAKKERPVKKQN